MKRAIQLGALAVLITAGLAISGCKMIESHNAMDTERVLSAAGFQMKFADTPEKITHLESLPQRKIVAQDHDGEAWYVYADSTHCNCLYVGNQAAYERYQKIAITQEIADENEMSAAMNEDAAMNWGAWGGFRPWY